MRQNRHPQQLRDIRLECGYNRYAEGSAFLEWGHNKIIATVSIEDRLPRHLHQLKGHKGGWLTAEYGMLPRSTDTRSQRPRLYDSGRTQEIQRLISRSLRSVVDLNLFDRQTLLVDIDVLQADGGTRCAGILAGYAALHHAANELIRSGRLSEWPLRYEIAAVSVGMVQGKPHIDLEYSEDSIAEVDLNVVATADGDILEVQGGSEEQPIAAEAYVQLIASGVTAVQHILNTVRPLLR